MAKADKIITSRIIDEDENIERISKVLKIENAERQECRKSGVLKIGNVNNFANSSVFYSRTSTWFFYLNVAFIAWILVKITYFF